MESHKCDVERVDRYVIEFDESVCNEQWMEDFRSFYFDFYDLEEHAQHIAQMRARFGSCEIEGYGIVLENGKLPWYAHKEEYKERINRAINIKVISEDNEIHIDSTLVD